MRNIRGTLALVSSLAFLFISCTQVIPEPGSDEPVTVSGTLSPSGALPGSILRAARFNTSFEDGISAISAFPSVPENVYYTVSATKKGGGTEVRGDVNGKKFSIELTKGSKWTITATGYSDAEYKTQIFSGTAEVDLTEADYNPGISVSLTAITNGGTGSVKLSFTAPDTIKSVVAKLTKEASTGTETVVTAGNEKVETVNIEGGKGTLSLTGMEAGAWYAMFLFQDASQDTTKDGIEGNTLFFGREIVNIFSNLTTDAWQEAGGDFIKDGAFTVEEGDLNIPKFYVQGSENATYTPSKEAADENAGSYFAPFKTLKKAAEKVISRSKASPDTEYTIYIDGKVAVEGSDHNAGAAFGQETLSGAGEQASPDGEDAGESQDETAGKIKLTIKGLGENAELSASSCRHLYIASGADITLENITLSGGDLSGGDTNDFSFGSHSGGSVYIAEGGKLSAKNVTFSGNKTSRNGGAVFVAGRSGENDDVTFAIGEGVKFTGNSATGEKSCGGAVYIGPGNTVSLPKGAAIGGEGEGDGNTANPPGGAALP